MDPAAIDRSAVRNLFEATRRRLIETGTRNRLIHVNLANSRGPVVNVINERSDDIYSLLAHPKMMRFLARGTDRTGESSSPRLGSVEEDIPDPSRFLDSLLETPLGPDALQKKLLTIAQEARSAEEEQGVNILYLALGFLTWFEDENSRVPRQAPLVLVPVELVRNQRISTYELRRREEDLAPNLPLCERLKEDFGITLPELEAEEEWKPSTYFAAVRQAVSSREKWSVEPDAIQLGFFSFSKLLMYKDLDPEAWPGGTLETHPLTGGLLHAGFHGTPSSLDEHTRLDEVLPPSKLFHVVDADGSQTVAIEEARGGRNLVIQGPPGTGKSQTITNIIAAAVSEGKSVLFVAEKMAALSVVHDRLVRVGLRDVCLELHSKNANKKAVLEELRRTLDAGHAIPQTPGAPSKLTKVRDQLNQIDDALHSPIGSTGESPWRSLARQSRYLGLGLPAPSFSSPQLATMGVEEEKQLCAAIHRYATFLETVGSLEQHPLHGVTRFDLQPVELRRLLPLLEKAAGVANDLSTLLADTHVQLGVGAPSTLAQATLALLTLESLKDLPNVQPQAAVACLGAPNKARLTQALSAGLSWRSSSNSASERFLDGTAASSLASLRGSFLAARDSLFARYGSAFRHASQELAGHLRVPLPASPAERLALVEELFTLQTLRNSWHGDETYCEQHLSDLWCGERTDFELALALARWCQRCVEAPIRISAENAVRLAVDAPSLGTRIEQLRAASAAASEALSQAIADLHLQLWGSSPLQHTDLALLAHKLRATAEALDSYSAWAQAATLRARLETLGLASLVTRMDEKALPASGAVAEFRYARAEHLWQKARGENPALQNIVETDRSELVANFCTLEREHLQNNVTRIRARHLAQIPAGVVGEMKVIRGEIGKKRRHMPIRKLVSNAGSALQRIKPVLLMSPISVAQFLPPGALSFDLLVIDEASQVRPEDALGAVTRARQIVVVGDPKQLPPTSFFDRLMVDDAEESDMEDEAAQDELLGGAARAEELESILTLCEARGLPTRMLRWHYRSKDPSLIRVSNREFYRDQLILPPSPLQGDADYGLRFTRVHGVYDRGEKRDNRIEADAVVTRAAEHARLTPDRTLGIATFSAAQRNLVTELLELRRRTDPVLDDFLREGAEESVFVKNIENIQGDERDVILISVCYGPSTAGGRLSSMSFGPVNSEGGERRLNVLFTRARLRCEVFASFDPEDIDPSRAKGEGIRIFKSFLDFAKTGKQQQPIVTEEEPETPLEEDVAEAIRAFGFLADPQVGSAGFRIDIGVRHPSQPGKYLLAIECDGATYHSALWARERDRLRQDVLEGLGWRFHRIWSTDWFYRRKSEIDRLHAALSSALEEGAPVHEDAPLPPAAPAPEDAVNRPAKPRQSTPYAKALFPVESAVEPHLADVQLLANLVWRIVEFEGPIHEEEVARRIASSFGRDRAGSRILAAAQAAIEQARRANDSLLHEGPFWFTSEQLAAPPVRDRS